MISLRILLPKQNLDTGPTRETCWKKRLWPQSRLLPASQHKTQSQPVELLWVKPSVTSYRTNHSVNSATSYWLHYPRHFFWFSLDTSCAFWRIRGSAAALPLLVRTIKGAHTLMSRLNLVS